MIEEWIRVDQRLPAPDEAMPVLITHVLAVDPEQRWVCDAMFEGGVWEFFPEPEIAAGDVPYKFNGTFIIAWMPKPKPYGGSL